MDTDGLLFIYVFCAPFSTHGLLMLLQIKSQKATRFVKVIGNCLVDICALIVKENITLSFATSQP